MAKSRPFRASNPFIRKEMAAARAMMHKRTPVQTFGDPKIKPLHKSRGHWDCLKPWQEKENAANADRVNYAASLGRKRGLLPLDMSTWEARSKGDAVQFREPIDDEDFHAPITIKLSHLDWVPIEPVHEVVDLPPPY